MPENIEKTPSYVNSVVLNSCVTSHPRTGIPKKYLENLRIFKVFNPERAILPDYSYHLITLYTCNLLMYWAMSSASLL